jgi:hypothetical protein
VFANGRGTAVKSDRVRRVLALFLCLLVFAVVAVGAWQSAGAEAWTQTALVTVPTTVSATASTTTLPQVPTTVSATATTYVPHVPTTVSATASTTTLPQVPTTVSATAFTTVTEPTATTTVATADEGGLAGGYIALIVVVVVALVGLGGWTYSRRRGSPSA